MSSYFFILKQKTHRADALHAEECSGEEQRPLGDLHREWSGRHGGQVDHAQVHGEGAAYQQEDVSQSTERYKELHVTYDTHWQQHNQQGQRVPADVHAEVYVVLDHLEK